MDIQDQTEDIESRFPVQIPGGFIGQQELGADGYITKPLNLMDLGRIAKNRWEKYKKSAPVS